MSQNSARTYLDTLPVEILYAIIDLLPPGDIKQLSCASKQLREGCLPSLFRQVHFEFSQYGFEELESIIQSDVRQHIISFIYKVPELLKPEVIDFDRFKSDILTPDRYVEDAYTFYDEDDPEWCCPPYMKIYYAAQSICEEQHNIVEEGLDLELLSSALRALPRLKEVGLDFCAMVNWIECLELYIADISMAEKSHEHHIRVVSSAIQSARKRGICVNTLSLYGFDSTYWQYHDLQVLLEPLRELLGCAQVLRLTASESALKLLSRCLMELHQLDMCFLLIQRTALEDFLEVNKKSIRSISFHLVRIYEGERWEESAELSSSNICSMLNVPQSTPVREVDCSCFLFWKERWRQLLSYRLYSCGKKRKIIEK